MYRSTFLGLSSLLLVCSQTWGELLGQRRSNNNLKGKTKGKEAGPFFSLQLHNFSCLFGLSLAPRTLVLVGLAHFDDWTALGVDRWKVPADYRLTRGCRPVRLWSKELFPRASLYLFKTWESFTVALFLSLHLIHQQVLLPLSSKHIPHFSPRPHHFWPGWRSPNWSCPVHICPTATPHQACLSQWQEESLKRSLTHISFSCFKSSQGFLLFLE